jgi:hypothetical protein
MLSKFIFSVWLLCSWSISLSSANFPHEIRILLPGLLTSFPGKAIPLLSIRNIMEKGCELEGVCTNLGQSLGWREGWGICAAQLTRRYHEQDSEEIRSVTSTILTWLWGVMESSSLKERSVLQKKGSGALIFQILTYLGSFFFFFSFSIYCDRVLLCSPGWPQTMIFLP